MSITSQINRLLQAKADIKSAIENKGGTVSSSAKLNDYAGLINNLAFPVVQPLSVTSNGTYSASSGYAYNPVTVNVQGGGGSGDADEIIMRMQTNYRNSTASYVGRGAFAFDNLLASVEFTHAGDVYQSAFYSCPNLQYASFPEAGYIDGNGASPYAFYNCSTLRSIYMPHNTTVGSYAFFGCSALRSVSFPDATRVGSYAFYGCRSLKTVYIPKATYISSSAFYGCSSLENVTADKCDRLYSAAFSGCSSLKSINMPELTRTDDAVFSRCYNLKYASFLKLNYLGRSTFYECRSLETVYLGNVGMLAGGAFYSCYNLLSLYMMGSSVADGIGGIFDQTMIFSSKSGVYGSVFVPASLYEGYITTFPWSKYADRFVSLTDEEIAALE